MGLDYGLRRTGVALSDPSGTLARPHGVVVDAATDDGLRQIEDIVAAEEIEHIVVGLPLTLRGEVGPQAQSTQAFVKKLQGRLAVTVTTLDERFTTTLAQATPSDTAEDALAAAHLLQSYLDSRSHHA